METTLVTEIQEQEQVIARATAHLASLQDKKTKVSRMLNPQYVPPPSEEGKCRMENGQREEFQKLEDRVREMVENATKHKYYPSYLWRLDE